MKVNIFDDEELNQMIINDEVYKTMPQELQSMYLYYKISAIKKCMTLEKFYNLYKKDAEGVS